MLKEKSEASQHHSEAAHSPRREGAGSLATSGPPSCNGAPYPATQPGNQPPIRWRRHCIPGAVHGPPDWRAALMDVTPAALCRISRRDRAVAGAGACLPASTAAGAWRRGGVPVAGHPRHPNAKVEQVPSTALESRGRARIPPPLEKQSAPGRGGDPRGVQALPSKNCLLLQQKGLP